LYESLFGVGDPKLEIENFCFTTFGKTS